MKTSKEPFLAWQRRIISRFLPEIRPDQRKLLALALLSLVMTAANTSLIWMIGSAVSEIAGGRFEELNRTLLIIAGIVLVAQIMRFIYTYHLQRISLRFVDRVRGRLLDHVMFLSFPIMQTFAKGDLMTRLSGNVTRLLTFFVNAPLNFLSNVVIVVVYASMLFWIDWKLALIALAFAPLFFLAQLFVAPRAGEASRSLTRERVKLVSMEEQVLANLRGISAFTGETSIREAHHRQFDMTRQWALKVRRIRVLNNAFTTFLVYVAGLTIVFSGISGVQSGQTTLGALVSFLIYLRFSIFPIRNIAHIPVKLAADRPAAERVMELLDSPPTVVDHHPNNALQIHRGEIEFRDVLFSYPNTTRQVLTNVSHAIHGGECVALVGPSGSGKSTFANLLLRFYDPQQGSIAIDGTDISTVSLVSLRRQLSIVWQEPFLIDGSLRDNLRLARPDASDDQISSACQASYCSEFIDKLDRGLDTIIGVRGVALSVGQRQRIAIAQAFLRDTPILVLDEASSALDSSSEKVISEALQRLREGRTTLIIAHRYSSIRAAGRILYFAGDGTVVTGTHEELLQRIEHYERAVAWQTGGR